MTYRDYVIAQIKHEETDYIPYELRLAGGVPEKLTEFYGSDSWRKELHWPIATAPSFFDSWDNQRWIDPSEPNKTIDAYGNHWNNGGAIAHLDQGGMAGMDPKDYKWPELKDFFWDDRKAMMQHWCQNIPSNQFSMIPLGAGHWELTWRLLGVEEALIATIDDPGLFDDIVEHLDVLLNKFLDAVLNYPSDAIFICDDWCDQRTCTFGVETWRRHIKPRLARFYEKAHGAGKYVIQHVCGNMEPLLPDLIDIGLDVLETVQPEAMDVYKAKRQYGDKITFFGALGVQNTINFGTPDQIREEIRRLRRELGKGGGFILAPCKHIDRVVPAENLAAIYETFIEENYKFR